MPDIDVKAYIGALRKELPYVPPIPVRKIKALHGKGDLSAIVKLVRGTMNINVHVALHWTSERSPTGSPNAPAWITRPQTMPYYGSAAFKDVKAEMFIRKQFARASPYHQFAMAVAHEFSHIILDSINHPLRNEEKAVDLTAMLLGFSYLYRKGAHTIEQVSYNGFRRQSLGYLSEREVDAACRILVPQRMRAKHALSEFAKRNAARLAVLGVLMLLVGSPFVFQQWKQY
jgi:hypothetical protein